MSGYVLVELNLFVSEDYYGFDFQHSIIGSVGAVY